MKPAVLFVNTGTGRNLGDRAMLLNLLDIVSREGTDLLLVPRQLPEHFRREFHALPYTPYHECLDRFRRRLAGNRCGRLLLPGIYVLHAVGMAIACLLLRLLPAAPTTQLDELQLLANLKRVDAVWLNGGGYLTDKGQYECRCCLLTALFGLLLGKQVILSGQGIGPVPSRITRLLLRWVSRHASFIAVRDVVRSQALLEAYTGGQIPVIMAGDDATSLYARTHSPDPEAIREVTESPRIALHFRISPFTENSERLKQQFADTVSAAFARGWRPVFFIFTSQREWELQLLQELLAGIPSDRYDLIESEDPRVIKSHIAQCHIAVGIAYHFVVFCLTTGVPVIALYGGEYYRYKMAGILRQYGKENWMTDFSEFVADGTISRLSEFLQQQNMIHTELQTQTQKISAQHHLSIQNALGAI